MEKTNLNDYSLASFLLEAIFKRYYEGSILYRMCDFELTKEKKAYELKVKGKSGVHTVNLSMSYSCDSNGIKGTVTNNIGGECEQKQSFSLFVIGSNTESYIWIMYVDDKLYNLIDVPRESSLTTGVPYGTKIFDAVNQIALSTQCQMFLLARSKERAEKEFTTPDGKEHFTLSLTKEGKDLGGEE